MSYVFVFTLLCGNFEKLIDCKRRKERMGPTINEEEEQHITSAKIQYQGNMELRKFSIVEE